MPRKFILLLLRDNSFSNDGVSQSSVAPQRLLKIEDRELDFLIDTSVPFSTIAQRIYLNLSLLILSKQSVSGQPTTLPTSQPTLISFRAS